MPRMTFDTQESHALLTAADTAAATGQDPALVDLYRSLAVDGVDLEACTADEELRAQLGMPPLPDPAADTAPGAGDGGDHPRVA